MTTSHPSNSPPPLTLLIVDDEELVLEATRKYLTTCYPFIVDTVRSGKKALSMLSEKKYDAVIADYAMEGMSGIDLLKAVRERGDEVSFIIFTGRGREDVVIESFENGVDGYVQKGTDIKSQFAELAHRITTVALKKRAESNLRNSELKYRQLFESNDAGIALHEIITDDTGNAVDYRFLDVNPAFEQLTGLHASDIIGKTVLEVLPGTESLWIKNYGEVAKTGKRIHFEEFSSEIGKYFEVRAYAPEPGQFVTLFRDITARKQIEEALRVSEHQYRSVVEYASEGIVITQEGVLQFINPRALEMIDSTLEKSLHHPFITYIHPEDKEMVYDRYLRRLRGEFVPTRYDFRVIGKTGKVIWVRISAIKILWKGEPAILNFLTDITDYREAEEGLKKSRILLEEAMDLAHLVNWEFDVSTEVFTFDDRFYALYGTSAEQEGGYQMAAEKYAREFLHPDDQHMVAEEVNKAIKATDPGFVSQVQHRIIRRDGEIRHIVVRFRITKDASGRTVKTHGANQDITELKLALEALKQKNRQLNLLTSITRHDINNNVSIIFSYLDLAKQNNTDPSMNQCFDIVELATKAIQTQIEFTRVYERLGSLEPRWQDLKMVITRLTIPENITLKITLPDMLIYADPMFESVFQNLLDNSIRHGETVSGISVYAIESDEGLFISWEDNGIGVPFDEKEQIFERGYGKNTGLGLFLVRDVLSLTNITIQEVGIPGEGAIFRIFVPKGKYRIQTDK